MSGMKTTGNTPMGDSGITRSDFPENLNQLLEHYLILLDQYQSLQAKLSKLLSSGYICLAEANFTSTRKTRYGQDFYDERMQASKKITERDSLVPSFELVQPSPNTPNSESKANMTPDGVSSPSKARRVASDPLNWFGILVPPALRTAQREFTDTVANIVPKLVEVVAEMDLYEGKIQEARDDGKHGKR